MIKTVRFFLLLFVLLGFAAPVAAQGPEFQVHARRNFGYGSGGNVRGSFSFTIVGNQANIRAVSYRMDGKEVAVVRAAPFAFSFNTGSYPDGLHEITAVVDTQDGRQVTTPPIRLNFLSASQESQAMRQILVPLLGVVVVLMLVGVVAQVSAARRGLPAPGAPRNYGLKGGAICPRCGRAYAIHFWSLNLIGGYFDRCDYCGKWSLVRSRSRAELEAAVQAELSAAQASESSLPAAEGAQTEEERLRKLMDESKYSE